MGKFYIPRTLLVEDKRITEAELLDQASVIVVLAEPGAGKSDLLEHMAALLQTKPVRASIFKHRTTSSSSTALVVDAMDEVARINKLATDEIIVRASEVTTNKVVFAGRSSEWDSASTKFIEDCFGQTPILARLQAFTEPEQRQLFEHEFLGEDFDDFAKEVEKFELSPLLGNPQFLLLLGEAYLQSNRQFVSKSQIFSDAVRRLAHEMSANLGQQTKPSLDPLISQADRVFAKLMLSGSTGVASVENIQDQDFPYIRSLCDTSQGFAKFLLDTRLFKPAPDPDQHEPVHRIVSEYCAARHLAQRVDNAADRLSLKRVLSVIAPNRVVRDELRGMLGWMAALGNENTQKEIINLDPYAVLANGDPSQLRPPSKAYLIDCLQSLAEHDPYFRRSDRWRTFNVGQFFTSDVVDRLRSVLTPSNPNHSLVQLILELLPGTEAAKGLQPELRTILLSGALSEQTRLLALSALLGEQEWDYTQDVHDLVVENSKASLRVASLLVETKGVERVGQEAVVALLRKIAGLYPVDSSRRDRSFDSRFFIGQLIGSFSETDTAYFLDSLTKNLRCTCKPKREFRCTCRVGISKVVGHLLDNYFERTSGPYDPARIWQWTRNLHFNAQGRQDRSESIRVLVSDNSLRQAIHRTAFAEANNFDEIQKIRSRFFYSPTHSGLRFQLDDLIEIAKHAFDENDPNLWIAVYGSHNPWGTKEPDELRRLMRGHANSNPDFMRLWASRERKAKEYRLEEFRSGRPSRSGRYERRQERTKEKNRAYLEANKTLIESGQHWGWLSIFGQQYLLDQDQLEDVTYEQETAEKALRNCFPFLAEHIPTLEELSEGQGYLIAKVLHAACVVHFRDKANLQHIDHEILNVVKTETGGYPGFREGEEEAFEKELDRVLFPDSDAAEAFVRSFIQPRLSASGEAVTRVDWLNYKTAFNSLRETLPMEWLRDFPAMPLSAERTLFEMAAQYGDRQGLLTLIEERATAPLKLPGTGEEADKIATLRHQFWQLMAFLFLAVPPTSVWDDFKADPDSIFLLERRLGRLHSDEITSAPPLSAEKVRLILDAYVDRWPKVPLPSSWGTGSPKGETAYRFLCDIVWKVELDLPDRSIAAIDQMLEDSRFSNFRKTLLTQRASSMRKLALQDFQAPSPAEIGKLLENNQVASVEDLRALMLEELENLQTWLRGAETDPIDTFYDDNGQHVDENTARNRIVDRLEGRMKALALSVVIEHHMAKGKRCDFTAAATISGARKLLTVEVKGQWHRAIYTAASEQLEARYAIHPDAALQGVYLVLWFGPEVKIAGRQSKTLHTPEQLRDRILGKMPPELHPFVDVFVLDLSRQDTM
nr:hypothetical protein [uncultured Hyphomonas sp.]